MAVTKYEQVGRMKRDVETGVVHLEFNNAAAFYQFKAGTFTATLKMQVMGKFCKMFSTYWEKHEGLIMNGPVIPCLDHEMKHNLILNTKMMLPINIKYDDLIALGSRGKTIVTIEEV